jgi:hypothetical protein
MGDSQEEISTEPELATTDPRSGSSLAPSSAQPSPGASPVLQATSVLVSLAAMSWIGYGWIKGLIPDWKYALGGIIIASLPAGVIGKLALKALDRLPGGRK